MSYDISALSEFLVDGKLNIFESAYKDLRFNVRMARYVTVDSAWEANLPGLSYAVYGTTTCGVFFCTPTAFGIR